jgi:hypothetical protein
VRREEACWRCLLRHRADAGILFTFVIGDFCIVLPELGTDSRCSRRISTAASNPHGRAIGETRLLMREDYWWTGLITRCGRRELFGRAWSANIIEYCSDYNQRLRFWRNEAKKTNNFNRPAIAPLRSTRQSKCLKAGVRTCASR